MSDSGTLGENGLQLNPDKSEALIVRTTNQLRAVTSCMSSVSVAGVDLPVADNIKVLDSARSASVVSQARLGVAYHAQASQHIRHLLTTELAQTLACSLFLSRINYCNAVLHGAPNYSMKKLRRVQNRSSDRSRGSKTIPRQPVVKLATRSADDRVLSGSADVQNPQHLDAVVPPSPNPGSRTWPQPAIDHYYAVSTFSWRRHL